MSETIKTIDLSNKKSISDRDIYYFFDNINSIDVNQITGEILITDNNSISIYPQSLKSVNSSKRFYFFGVAGTLNQPYDAKFDYIRKKVWISDTGNNRVLKISPDKTNNVEVIIDDVLITPFAIEPNINNGGCFVSGFLSSTKGIIVEFASNGKEISRYEYTLTNEFLSSSSSSESVDFSSSSSSIGIISVSLFKNIKYDHVRKRIWWGHNNVLYMVDQRNNQIKTFKMANYIDIKSLDIELNNGYAFVVITDVHGEDFIIQVNRDNNLILSEAYKGEI